MNVLGGTVSVTGITFFMFSVFLVMLLGYLLGKISIKGVSLGTSGVFVIALLYGALFGNAISRNLIISISNINQNYSSNALKIIENTGLILFVTSVGFIAGPNFFKNLKKNYKSYILLGVVIIIGGALACVVCYFTGRASFEDRGEFVAMLVGALSGSLTSTPAFSAAKATVAESLVDAVTVGYGITYLFGVIGVVLFVQLIPKLTHADMPEERRRLLAVDTGGETEEIGEKMDPLGFFAFAAASVIGILIGAIRVPLSAKGLSGTTFSLTTTGGTLLASLVFGHFGHIGKISLKVDKKVLEVFREFGLVLFLTGAGISGGAKFVEYFRPIYFVYGILMTALPMITGYLFARYVLRLSLLNALGSICGGMTSTPALGTLIHVSGTDEVVSAYAATYPIALIAVVLVSQFLILLL